MKLNRRLKTVEDRAAVRRAMAPPDPRTDEEWVEEFECMDRAGYMDHETDFRRALAEYHAAGAAQKERLFDWLVEMVVRRSEGTPPVSEAEFAQLGQWFEANATGLYRRCEKTQLLDLGDGRVTSVANLRYGLRCGPRAFGAGKLAHDLRLIRARYGPLLEATGSAT